MTSETAYEPSLWRRLYGAPLIVVVSCALLMVVMASLAGLPIRDPEGFLGPTYVRLPLIALVFLAADVLPRVIILRPARRQLYGTLVRVLRERWSGPRLAVTAAGLAVFYLSYITYRNLKSFLPFMQERREDGLLLNTDRWLGGGQYPADIIQEILGTGASATVLSAVYMFYMLFVPLSLAAALIWFDNVSMGAWYVTALSFNWLLGALSYYALPSLGPIYIHPTTFADLPDTPVDGLQEGLWRNRLEVLADPHGTADVHGIAAFASLHASVVFTAALIAHLARLPKLLRWSLWTFTALTSVATVYFGWHYIVDVPAGFVIGALAVWLAALAVGRTTSDKSRLSMLPT